MWLPSLPSDLALEKRINPFLRVIAFDVAWIDDLTQFAKHRARVTLTLKRLLRLLMLFTVLNFKRWGLTQSRCRVRSSLTERFYDHYPKSPCFF